MESFCETGRYFSRSEELHETARKGKCWYKIQSTHLGSRVDYWCSPGLEIIWSVVSRCSEVEVIGGEELEEEFWIDKSWQKIAPKTLCREQR